MYQSLVKKEKKLAVIGLGYVGLPVALAFAKHLSVIGFDISDEKIQLLKQSTDPSKEVPPTEFKNSDITFTSCQDDLKNA
ncbi:MAG: nucleotide sugar dehydrogenase, partial [Bacteroidota bacterium]|nr:nucleotide sugar dehydrogenase [Bacteroidota bacterium]